MRVLIVDDHEDIRKILRRLLSVAGFEVVGEVTTGEDAIAWFSEEAADLVVMDLQMPGIGGVEATRQIKAAHPAVLVFGFTGWGERDMNDMLAAGAEAVFEKTAAPALIDAMRAPTR